MVHGDTFTTFNTEALEVVFSIIIMVSRVKECFGWDTTNVKTGTT